MTVYAMNQVRCIQCGACVDECPANLFSRERDKAGRCIRVTRDDPHGWCTGCGHCVAVCSRDAIVCDVPVDNLEPAIRREDVSDYGTILPFLKSKRSVRRYTCEPVPGETVDDVLEAMRMAPTGHNAQGNRYLVVTDRNTMAALSDHTIRSFRSFRTLIRLKGLLRPFLPGALNEILNSPGLLEGIDDMIGQRERGEDPILFDAPVVIISYNPNMGAMSHIDPAIAFTYGMLAAHSLGLGSCWIGFAIQAMRTHKRMRELLGLPAGCIVSGVMTLGHPKPVYHRVPPRNAVDVRWIGERSCVPSEAVSAR